jgi:hypothetical protein
MQAHVQPPSWLLLLLLLLPLQLRTFCNANEPAKKLTELLGSWLDELTSQQVSCICSAAVGSGGMGTW